MGFLKRLGRAIADILTSKKAIAAASAAVAHQFGADPEIVAAIGTYIIGQAIADHGKEAAKKRIELPVARLHTDAELAEKLQRLRIDDAARAERASSR